MSNNQKTLQKIHQYLEQLPEEKLNQVASFLEKLISNTSFDKSKTELIHSLKGKYQDILTPTEILAKQKQDEITLEN